MNNENKPNFELFEKKSADEKTRRDLIDQAAEDILNENIEAFMELAK